MERRIDTERAIDSLKFEWTVAHTQLLRHEQRLKELRLTSLLMSIVVFAVVGGFFATKQDIPISSMRIVLMFSSVWWGTCYVASLILPTMMRTDDADMAHVSVDMERFDDDIAIRDQVRLLEETRYQAMRYGRWVRIITQLVAFGVLLTMMTMAMALTFG